MEQRNTHNTPTTGGRTNYIKYLLVPQSQKENKNNERNKKITAR